MSTAVYDVSRKIHYYYLFSLETETVLLASSKDFLGFPMENSKQSLNMFLYRRGDIIIYSLQIVQDKAKA